MLSMRRTCSKQVEWTARLCGDAVEVWEKIRSLYCHSLEENIGKYAFQSPGEKEFDFYLMK